MGIQVTVDLPSKLYRQAQQLAHLTGRDIEEVVTSTLEISLPVLVAQAEAGVPVESLADEQVMELAELEIDHDRLRLLMGKQQDKTLTVQELFELQTLFHLSEIGLRRKAQALAEAIKRGLRAPLKP